MKMDKIRDVEMAALSKMYEVPLSVETVRILRGQNRAVYIVRRQQWFLRRGVYIAPRSGRAGGERYKKKERKGKIQGEHSSTQAKGKKKEQNYSYSQLPIPLPA